MSPTGNSFLDSLSPQLSTAVLSICNRGELPQRHSLYSTETSPEHVYFLTSGVASIVVTMPEGRSSEVGMIGSEGLVGSDALLGIEPSSTECFMLIAGQGFYAPTRELRAVFEENSEFRLRTLKSVQAQIVLTAQFSACNRLHEAEGRLARLLLMTSDLAHKDDLDLKQAFLGEMLGTQRTTMALVAGVLQRAGLISYRRAKLHIENRTGLERVSCFCYQVFKRINQKHPAEPALLGSDIGAGSAGI